MSVGLNYRMVKCANCDHYIPRGSPCTYCLSSDAAANIPENALERLMARAERHWGKLPRVIRVIITLALLLLLFTCLYLVVNIPQSTYLGR